MSSKVLLPDDFRERNKLSRIVARYVKPLVAITIVAVITFLYQQTNDMYSTAQFGGLSTLISSVGQGRSLT